MDQTTYAKVLGLRSSPLRGRIELWDPPVDISQAVVVLLLGCLPSSANEGELQPQLVQ